MTVYVLDAAIPASETLMNKAQLLDAIGHIVGEGKLVVPLYPFTPSLRHLVRLTPCG